MAHTTVTYKDSDFDTIDASDHQFVYDAWTSGKAFVTCNGVYGERITIKLGEVRSMTEWSDEAISRAEVEDMLTEE